MGRGEEGRILPLCSFSSGGSPEMMGEVGGDDGVIGEEVLGNDEVVGEDELGMW